MSQDIFIAMITDIFDNKKESLTITSRDLKGVNRENYGDSFFKRKVQQLLYKDKGYIYIKYKGFDKDKGFVLP